MKPSYKQVIWGVTAFLTTWQATNFDLDYRSVLSSIVTLLLAGGNPKKK